MGIEAAIRGAALVAIARAAIRRGLAADAADSADEPRFDWLDAPGATFVTLERGGELRGCVGSLEAVRPLREDVRRNAAGAAFRDLRFEPLAVHELPGLRVEVSELSAPEPIEFDGEADLPRRLVPGVDGVVLGMGARRATFLPRVWEHLPAPEQFVGELSLKAGLPRGPWPRTVRAWRYRATCWQEVFETA